VNHLLKTRVGFFILSSRKKPYILNYFYPFVVRWQSVKILSAATSILLFFFCLSAKAQYYRSESKFSISVGTDYDAPVGNLSYTFKPTLNFNLNLLEHSGDFTGSISFGYHAYKPKLDTFYYQLSREGETGSPLEYGKIHYQEFTAYSLYLGLVYNVDITEQLKVYSGINLGAYYTHLGSYQSDFMGKGDTNFHEQELYIAPRLGFNFMLTDHVGIGLEGKYNFFAPTGKAQYNDRVGTLYNSYATGLRVIYSF
jgi:hypothetical protein